MNVWTRVTAVVSVSATLVMALVWLTTLRSSQDLKTAQSQLTEVEKKVKLKEEEVNETPSKDDYRIKLIGWKMEERGFAGKCDFCFTEFTIRGSKVNINSRFSSNDETRLQFSTKCPFCGKYASVKDIHKTFDLHPELEDKERGKE